MALRERIKPKQPGDGSELKETESKPKSAGLGADRPKILFLFFLYLIQGIILGICSSLPLILKEYNVSYKGLATLSLIGWPFSVKLLWAPVVDAIYIPNIGRRKSWLVPTQYLIGVLMLVIAWSVDDWLGEKKSKIGPNLMAITFTFFWLKVLVATQDIAVDGWALTMLSKRNVGYQSTCNTMGQRAGVFLGNAVFLALQSANFCNRYIRSQPSDTGILTLSSLLFFWGCVFVVTTTFVLIFIHERNESGELGSIEGVLGTYTQLLRIFKLRKIQEYAFLCITVKVGFAAAEGISVLKLVEAGVPKENISLLQVPLQMFALVLPLLIAKFTTPINSLDVMLKSMPYRLMIGLIFMLIVWWAPSVRLNDGEFPYYFYTALFLSQTIHLITVTAMFSSFVTFHIKISDPLIGGTYLTLLSTVLNLGSQWPTTVALYSLDFLTFTSCHGVTSDRRYNCLDVNDVNACLEIGGTCKTDIDGFYIECIICTLIGFVWLRIMSAKIRHLQNVHVSKWRVSH
ncbi:acetyl-coenzyme A transporter 1-like [Anneissia japonica]|uniref:acetyl-coenzyme A transporter 1-like n=1 Tax=Anneissia japonica TaxID=1529436 RepID=UPI001425A4C2|nr:acetyl-coenzyme A transporter 1-like [Anneissia japonica]